jgi:hypothetical protein
VVEKCLEHSPALCGQLVNQLVNHSVVHGGRPVNALLFMCKSKFGNYVVKALLRHSDRPSKAALTGFLQRHARSLEGHLNGSHVVRQLANNMY